MVVVGIVVVDDVFFLNGMLPLLLLLLLVFNHIMFDLHKRFRSLCYVLCMYVCVVYTSSTHFKINEFLLHKLLLLLFKYINSVPFFSFCFSLLTLLSQFTLKSVIGGLCMYACVFFV